MDKYIKIGHKWPLKWARFIKHRKKKIVIKLMEPPYCDLRINGQQERGLIKMFSCNPMNLNPTVFEMLINDKWMPFDRILDGIYNHKVERRN